MATGCPLRILSLDGGGVRGLSSLMILEDIMEQIGKVQCLDHTPRPCNYFDLIGGTSTGGIIAIMLGRLGMAVDEAIRAYRRVSKQAFVRKWTAIPLSSSGMYSASALQKTIKQVVREFCSEPKCAAQRRQGHPTVDSCPHGDLVFRDPACTKTAVLSLIRKEKAGSVPPVLFTTYDVSTRFQGCKVWEVARATSAATSYFKPAKLGRDGTEFIDAALGYNNPCEVLIREAQKLFPQRKKLKVLSIGTGARGPTVLRNNIVSRYKAYKDLATSSSAAHARLESRYGVTGQYFRFNVESGLQKIRLSDSEKLDEIAACTKAYIHEKFLDIKKFVDVFIGRFNIAWAKAATSQTGYLLLELGMIVPRRFSDSGKTQSISSKSKPELEIEEIGR